MLADDGAERAQQAAREAELREEAGAFWRRTSSSLGDAVSVLRESHGELTTAYREVADASAAQQQDFRYLTASWLDHYQATVDGILTEIASLLAEVRQGHVPARPAPPDLPPRPGGRFDTHDRQLVLLGHQVRDAIIQSAAVPTGTATAELTAMAGIGRRLRGRLNRVLGELDVLETRTEDPDLLHGLLRVDHLLVQMRRDGEAVQVLAGDHLRQSGDAADVLTILRQAIQEIEDYARVRIGAVAPVGVAAYARSSVIHVVAAVTENACRFSRDPVDIVSGLDSSGLVITVTDAGLHMSADDLRINNGLLADPDPAVVRDRLMEGRIGLLSAAMLARMYGLLVSLHPAGERGTRATVVVPPKLLILPSGPASSSSRQHGAAGTAVVTVDTPEAAAPRPPQPVLVRQRGAAPHAAPEEVRHDREQRPNLPRRHRATPRPAATREPDRAADAPRDLAAGTIGAFLQGAAHLGDPPPGRHDPGQHSGP